MTSPERDEPTNKAVAPLGGTASAVEPIPDRVPTDSVDLQLLRLLAQDSRTSQRALARMVGMSAPAVGERIARLERLGVIQRYSISVDWARLGYAMEVFLNILAVSGANIGELITELKSLPEVEFGNSVSGAFDLQARVRVRDHQHLTRLLINRIWQIPTIQRTETQLSFATVSQRDFTQNLLGYIRDHNERSSKQTAERRATQQPH